jgi:hypothetical protein
LEFPTLFLEFRTLISGFPTNSILGISNF